MSLGRIVNSGSLLLKQVYQPFQICTALSNEILKTTQSKCFSSLSNYSNNSFEMHKFLNVFNPVTVICRGMKVKGILKLRCKDCYFERKDGVLYVNCDSFPRHKQRQLTKKPKYTWILTFASQGKQRPY